MPILPSLNVTFTQRQSEAWLAVKDPNVREVGYGGAKGGGKSFWLCAVAFLLSWEVASRFKLPRTKTPIHLGWLGRKRATDFVQTTLQTWQRTIPHYCYELKGATEKHPRHILIDGRIAVDYGGLDNREDINKFNSAEYMFVGVDQTEETELDDVSVLMGSRRLTIAGQALDYKGLWTANPAACWFKDRFIDFREKGYRFIQALYKDNPYLPNDYVKTLEAAFSYRPDLLRAYRDGIWEGLSGVDQIILQEWITAASMRLVHQPYIKRLITVDPARFGDDRCVILGLENWQIVDVVVLPYCDTKAIAVEAFAMSVRWGNCPIVVEDVGIGGGTSDRLSEMGAHVIRYNPAGKASDETQCWNLRAEVWSTVARWLCEGVWDKTVGAMVSMPEPDRADTELWDAWRQVGRELTWPKYKFRGERVLVQPKEEIKADHEGRSPDFGDAYTQGVFHLPVVETVAARDRHKTTSERKSKIRM